MYSMDVTQCDQVAEVVGKIEQEVGPVDVLLSNAGVSQRGSVEDCLIDVHKKLMNINYFGQVNVVKGKYFLTSDKFFLEISYSYIRQSRTKEWSVKINRLNSDEITDFRRRRSRTDKTVSFFPWLNMG